MSEKKVRCNPRSSCAGRRKSGRIGILGVEHNQDTISLEQGELFVMRLYETFSGNQRWHMSLPPGLKVVDSWYVPARLDHPLNGGMRMWRISAQAAGEHYLKAMLACPQQIKHSIVLRFQLKVVVR